MAEETTINTIESPLAVHARQYAFIFVALVIVLFAANFIFLWFVIFYDILKNDFIYQNNKWVWFAAMFLLPFIAPLFYISLAKKQKIVE